MAWVRLDDHIDEHPKLIAVGALGFAQFVAGLAYCNRNLTDGFIPEGIADRLLDIDLREDVTALLVTVGLWSEVKGGYQVHDYLEYQPSKVQVRSEREATRIRVQNHRNRTRNSVTSVGGGNAVSNADVTLSPIPIPSTKRKKEVARKKRPLTPEQRAIILEAFKDLPDAEEEMDLALSHKAADKYTDMNLYVRNWLRRHREWSKPSRNGRKPYSNEPDAGTPLDYKNLGAFR